MGMTLLASGRDTAGVVAVLLSRAAIFFALLRSSGVATATGKGKGKGKGEGKADL